MKIWSSIWSSFRDPNIAKPRSDRAPCEGAPNLLRRPREELPAQRGLYEAKEASRLKGATRAGELTVPGVDCEGLGLLAALE